MVKTEAYETIPFFFLRCRFVRGAVRGVPRAARLALEI